jgi:SAM-dependent methyltransferase
MNSFVDKLDDSSIFWDKFYSSTGMKECLDIPSQFAVFCTSEFKERNVSAIVEFGAGSGRDSLLFAQFGFDVVATDISEVSLEILDLKSLNLGNIKSMHCDVAQDLCNFRESDFCDHETIAYYARFFLHAVPTQVSKRLIENIARQMRPGDIFAAEYRTPEDSLRLKSTLPHYRNFVDPLIISEFCRSMGLECLYDVRGLGFAKWKNDDAYVCRQLFKKL